MKLFDVMVHDTKRLTDVVYRSGLTKRDAKKLVKELQKKGFKSHALTSRNSREESGLQIEDSSTDEFADD